MLHIFTLIFVFFSFIFVGCQSSDTQDDNVEKPFVMQEPYDIEDIYDDINNTEQNVTLISKLNILRTKSGLIKLKTNNLLTISALNHATYLVDNNKSGHFEKETDQSFTGISAVDRTLYAGYKSKHISENVSTNQATPELSLDGLMGAIYHRFGFLSFDIDEIGYAKKEKSYVYNMSNSNLNLLCDKESFNGVGKYYKNVCLDENLKVDFQVYNDGLDSVINQNPSYVLYPYANQTDVTPSFYEEFPDPLPAYGVSGYPISIEFNKNDINISNFNVNNFILKDSDSNYIDLVSYYNGKTILDSKNDINHELSSYQFVIFPKERLDYNATYNIDFLYTYKAKNKKISWKFRTKSLKNLVVYNDEDLTLQLDKSYYVYFKPKTPNDTIKGYSLRCVYTQGGSVQTQNTFYDLNTLELKITGKKVQNCKLTLNDTKEISIHIK